MTLEDAEIFLKENAARLRRLGERKDTSLGFNAFALVSDTYYRENFHSDIIRAILDPHSGHGEGALFLRKFVDFISAEARSSGKSDLADMLQNLVVGNSVLVEREKGRVDIKIKATDWTIIVENKINGAGDMERQIPRYIDDCRNKGEKVVAVVYITASDKDKSYPSVDGWEPGDKEKVDALLIHVVGFTKTNSVRNLAEDWIGPCALAARGFNVKSILEQYTELLRHQAGDTMNQDEIKQMLSSMAANDIKYSELLRTLKEMPRTLAGIVLDEFKGMDTLLKRAFPYKETVAVLDPKDIPLPSGGKACFGIDVHCEDLDTAGISFFSRNNPEDGSAPNSAYVGFLKEYDSGFELGWNGRVVLTVNQDWAFGHIDEFLLLIRGLLDHLETNRKKMESICRGEKV